MSARINDSRMSHIAIIGAGPIGGALAHKLAARSRVGEIRLIDSSGRVAKGKALDILQSGPVEGFSTRVTGDDSLHAAAGADVIVICDSAAGDGEYSGDAALAMRAATACRRRRRRRWYSQARRSARS